MYKFRLQEMLTFTNGTKKKAKNTSSFLVLFRLSSKHKSTQTTNRNTNKLYIYIKE